MRNGLYGAIIASLPDQVRATIAAQPMALLAAEMLGLDRIINNLEGPTTTTTIYRLVHDLEHDGPIWRNIRDQNLLPFLRELLRNLDDGNGQNQVRELEQIADA